MDEFECEACGSAAVAYPKVLADAEPVVCARCAAIVSSYREFKLRIERTIGQSGNDRRVTGC